MSRYKTRSHARCRGERDRGKPQAATYPRTPLLARAQAEAPPAKITSPGSGLYRNQDNASDRGAKDSGSRSGDSARTRRALRQERFRSSLPPIATRLSWTAPLPVIRSKRAALSPLEAFCSTRAVGPSGVRLPSNNLEQIVPSANRFRSLAPFRGRTADSSVSFVVPFPV